MSVIDDIDIELPRFHENETKSSNEESLPIHTVRINFGSNLSEINNHTNIDNTVDVNNNIKSLTAIVEFSLPSNLSANNNPHTYTVTKSLLTFLQMNNISIDESLSTLPDLSDHITISSHLHSLLQQFFTYLYNHTSIPSNLLITSSAIQLYESILNYLLHSTSAQMNDSICYFCYELYNYQCTHPTIQNYFSTFIPILVCIVIGREHTTSRAVGIIPILYAYLHLSNKSSTKLSSFSSISNNISYSIQSFLHQILTIFLQQLLMMSTLHLEHIHMIYYSIAFMCSNTLQLQVLQQLLKKEQWNSNITLQQLRIQENIQDSNNHNQISYVMIPSTLLHDLLQLSQALSYIKTFQTSTSQSLYQLTLFCCHSVALQYMYTDVLLFTTNTLQQLQTKQTSVQA